MQKTLLHAREGVAFDDVLTIRDTAGAAVNITGWVFELDLTRQAGVATVSLEMVGSGGEGFTVVDGAAGQLRVRINQSSLSDVQDTTGRVTLFGDLFGTAPGGSRRFVADVRLSITSAGVEFEGGTHVVTLDAFGAVVVAAVAAEADRAEAARDGAALSEAAAESLVGSTYASTAAGLAAVAEGAGFAVDNGDGTVTIYRKVSGAAVAQRALATTAALAGAGGGDLLGLSDGSTLQDFRDGFGAVIYPGDTEAEIKAKIAAADAGSGLIIFTPGAYYFANVTTSADNLRVEALGVVRVTKNANGPIWTHTGRYYMFRGITFAGLGATYTGSNLVFTETEGQFWHCGSRDAQDIALDARKSVRVYGSNPIWHTLNAHGKAISNGTSGTATLYSQFLDIYTSTAACGIYFIDCGSQIVKGGQIGPLTVVKSGTPPIGINGGHYAGIRVVGAINVSVSDAIFTGCLVEGAYITFGAGTSGISFGGSNRVSPAVVINNLGNSSNHIERNTGTEDGTSGPKLRYGASAPNPADALGAGAEIHILPSADGSNHPDVANGRIYTPGYWSAAYGKGYQSRDSGGTVRNVAVIYDANGSVQIGHSNDAAALVLASGTAGTVISNGTQNFRELVGTGSPEGVVSAPVGSRFSRTDGGAGTCFYVKESGTGNTGWVAK